MIDTFGREKGSTYENRTFETEAQRDRFRSEQTQQII